MTAERHDVAAPSGTPRRARPAAASRGGEGGSALVIALIMIAVVAVVLLALLSYTGTSIRASASVRASRQTMYAADGAVEAAIQHVRNNPEIGYSVDENGDPVPSCDFDLPVQGDQPAVHVECEGQTASMRLGEGSVAADQPLYSILTLGRRANQQPNLNDESYFWSPNSWFDFGGKGEVGLYYNPALGLFGYGGSPAATAYLKGGVFSNSTIVASKGSLKIADEPDGSPGGSFKVRQSCGVPDGGQILVEPSGTNPNCQVIGYPSSGGGYGTDGQGVDPNYPSRIDLQGVPPLRSVPACPAGKDIVKFEPGWYNDAKALSELMRDCKGHDGKGADFWFRPGLYYFDFRNAAGADAPCSDNPREHQWCIGQGKSNPRIVGGTPLANDGGEWVENPGIITETRDITFGTATSSQAVAGTDDFVNKDEGRTINASLSSATFGPGSKTLKPAGSYDFPDLWEFGWGTWRWDGSPANAKLIDGSDAHVSLSCGFGACSTGVIRLNGYPKIPSNATPTAATLRIRHRESLPNGKRQQKIIIEDADQNALCSWNVPQRGSNTTDTWSLPGTCLNTAAKVNGLRARYLVQPDDSWWGTGGSDWYLDGIELDVTYTDNGVRTLTLTGPSPTFDNPAIVTVGSATAVVSHAEPAGSNPQLVVTAPSSPGCTVNLPTRATNTADSLSIMSCLGSNQAAALNGVTVAYRAGGGATSTTVSLDGIKITTDLVIAQEPERFRFPQGCDPEKPGVQFVFGGDSGIRVMDGTMNLCAGPPPGSPGQAGFTRQQIAYYGIKPLPALQASTVAAGGGGISNVQNALVLQENPTNQYANFAYGSGGECAFATCSSSPITLSFPGLAAAGYPALPPQTKVAKVEIRAQYDTAGAVTEPLFRIRRNVPGVGMQSCGDNVSMPTTLFGTDWDVGRWGEANQNFLDVTGCFTHGGATNVDMLKNFQVDWVARGYGCWWLGGCNNDRLDGIELYVTLEATSPTAQTWLPASGCIVGLPNYVGGGGAYRESCPLLKWNSGGPNFVPDDPAAMVSIDGTFYAPGGVLDLAEYGPYCSQTRKLNLLFWQVTVCSGFPDDSFDGLYYPVIDRGIIARHLVIRGLKVKPDYDEPFIGCGPGVCGGLIPNPKLVKFEAQVASDTRVTSWVCYGPVLDAPSDPSDVEVMTTGKFCSGDGTGPPKIVRWTVS